MSFNKLEVTKFINAKLDQISNSPKRKIQLQVATELFDYIVKNKAIFDHDPSHRFYLVVKNKLRELAYKNNARFEDHYYLLFNEFLPPSENCTPLLWTFDRLDLIVDRNLEMNRKIFQEIVCAYILKGGHLSPSDPLDPPGDMVPTFRTDDKPYITD